MLEASTFKWEFTIECIKNGLMCDNLCQKCQEEIGKFIKMEAKSRWKRTALTNVYVSEYLSMLLSD